MKPPGGISTLFWDVGGVLLTNGWDHHARRGAIAEFELDGRAFEERHEAVSADLETGRITLEQYLARTVFCAPRSFSPEEFRRFMLAQSRPHADALDLARRCAASGRFLMATLNNESRELNRYRIETFGLRRLFTAFFSSCYVGAAKPSRAIFEAAVRILQKRPEECLFVDDRAHNVEAAREVGLRAVLYRGADRLAVELAELGLEPREE